MTYIKAIFMYLILAIVIFCGFYYVHTQHPNHTQVELAWFFAIMIPLFPTYVYVMESK